MSKKGYKPETLRAIRDELLKVTDEYVKRLQAGENVKLCISDGNMKIGKCMNVSLAPIITCGNCKECRHYCYDVGSCLQYEGVRDARGRNTALFRFDRDEFFRQLWSKMSRRKKNFFLRIHVSGEIADVDHLSRIIDTARRFPEWRVWMYTKMYGVVADYCRTYGRESIPENLTIMISEWKGLPLVNPYNLPVFRCIDENDDIPAGMTQCPGNCDECKRDKKGCIYGDSCFVYLH